MSEYYLYHICRESDKDDFSQGYVGITKRKPESRWKEHRKNKSWYNDYQDIIEYVILEGTAKEIKEKEQELRPYPNMGWNKTAGNIELPFSHPAAKYAKYGKCKKNK
jgi:hypothetical protein